MGPSLLGGGPRGSSPFVLGVSTSQGLQFPPARGRLTQRGGLLGTPAAHAAGWDLPGFLAKRLKCEWQEEGRPSAARAAPETIDLTGEAEDSDAEGPSRPTEDTPTSPAPSRSPQANVEGEAPGAPSEEDDEAPISKRKRPTPIRAPPVSGPPSARLLDNEGPPVGASDLKGAPRRACIAPKTGPRHKGPRSVDASDLKGAPRRSNLAGKTGPPHRGPSPTRPPASSRGRQKESKDRESSENICDGSTEAHAISLASSDDDEAPRDGDPNRLGGAPRGPTSLSGRKRFVGTADALGDSQLQGDGGSGIDTPPLRASQQGQRGSAGAGIALTTSPTLRRHVDPFYGSVGKIARVILRDFCNHEHLDWRPSPFVNLILGGNGQGKSAIAKAIFVCCGAERAPTRDRMQAGAEGPPQGAPRKSPHSTGSTAGLIRGGERPRLFEYIRQYWSEGGPPKAVISLTFSNFSSAGSSILGPCCKAKGEAREGGEGIVSRVSNPTGDAFVPIDKAFSHGLYGDYITLTREITKKRRSRKQQQQQQQQQQDAEEEACWETGSSTWYIEGEGSHRTGRKEIRQAEVAALLTHFGLELTNPAVYLSQELAKTFLFRASEQSLYKFYLCASGLDAALTSLGLAEERHQSALRELKAFGDRLLPAKEAHALLEQQLAQCKQLRALKDEASSLKSSLTHLRAAEAAKAAEVAAADVAELERQQEEQQRESAAGVETQQQEMDRCRAVLQQQQEELRQLQQQQQQQKEQLAATSRKLRAKRGEASSLRQDAEASREMQAALNAVIQRMQLTLQGPTGPSAAEAAELSEKETAEKAAAAALAKAEDALQQLRRASAAAQQAAAKARGVTTEAELRLQAAQHQARHAARELQQQQQLLQRLQQQHSHRRRAFKESLEREREQQKRAAAAAAKTAAGPQGPPSTQQQQAAGMQLLQQQRREALQRSSLYTRPRWAEAPPDLAGLLESLGALLAQGRFSRAPLGPLAEYLFVDVAACKAAGVPAEAAQAILEEHLSQHASTWIVGSIEDQRLLLPLLQRHRWMPRVAVVNFNCPPYGPRLTEEALGIPKGVLTLYKAIRKETSQGEMRPNAAACGDTEERFMPMAGVNFLVDSAAIERVAIAADGMQLRALLLQRPPPPQQQQFGGGPRGFARGIREGYAWKEAMHLKRQGGGTEGVPCAQGDRARRARGLVRLSLTPTGNNAAADPAAAAAAAAAAGEGEEGPPVPPAVPELGPPEAALEEELRQEWAAEETLLQQKKDFEAAARGEMERTAKALAAAREADTNAAEELQRCEEAEARQQGEVQLARDGRDDARLALSELRSKHNNLFQQKQLKGLQEQLAAKERQRDEEQRQEASLQQRLEETIQAVASLQEAHEASTEALKEVQKQAADAAKGLASAEAALHAAEKKVERWKDEEATAAALAASRQAKLQRKRASLEALRAEAKRLQEKCLPLAEGEKLPDFTVEEAEKRLGSLEIRIREQAAETRDEKEVEAQLKESARVLQAQEQQLLAPQAAAKLAKENSEKRTQKFLRAVELSSKQTRADFQRMVEGVLPHSANLVFDHMAQRVTIQTKDRNQQYVSSDPKSLSGGEKSCVQVAFLAALAQRSNSPAHIFDEVDVFMDERSRIKNFTLLLDMALQMRQSTQCFFITPHWEIQREVQDRYSSDLVKVFNIRGSVQFS